VAQHGVLHSGTRRSDLRSDARSSLFVEPTGPASSVTWKPRAASSISCGALISVGEALIDFLPRDGGGGGSAADGSRFQPVCGGAPFNVVRTIARLGAPAAFLSNISTDMFGDQICSELEAEGVDLTLVRRVAAPTTLAFVKMEPGLDPQYAFFYRQAADRSLTANSLPALPHDVAAVHLSLGAITLEAPVASAFRCLLERSQVTFRSFDPNIRERMIPDLQAYKQLLLTQWLSFFDLIKVSNADLAFLYRVSESSLELDIIAEEWLNAAAPAIRLLLITLGPDGTLAYRPGRGVSPVVRVASGGVSSWMRPILTDIYLSHSCSCQAILRTHKCRR
jgi:fructokinase